MTKEVMCGCGEIAVFKRENNLNEKIYHCEACDFDFVPSKDNNKE